MKLGYKLKTEEMMNELAKNGYDLIPNTVIAFKIIEQDLDSDLVKHLLNTYYENKRWQETFYKKNKEEFFKTIGLEYKKGKPVMSEKFTTMLKSWRIEVDPYDSEFPYFLSFRSMDFHDIHTFYQKDLLDKYFGEEIKSLLEKGIIEEVGLEDEGGYMEQ